MKHQGINRKILMGNRFHVTQRIVSPYILCKINHVIVIPCLFHLWNEVT